MKKKALFLYTNSSSFIKGDLEILSREYLVTQFKIENSSPLKLAMSLAKLFAYLLFNLSRFDFTYTWFADYHSYFPILFCKLFRKKSFLVIGGYDVCREKRYGYGSFINPIRGFMTIYSIKNASKCLAVSKNIKRVINKISPVANCEVLYNGVSFSDTNVYTTEKEPIILCVSIVSSRQTYFIKGIDRLIEAAKIMPHTKFILVGADKKIIKSICPTIPDNIEIVSRIEHSCLIKYYSRAKVYCQLSRRESFCLALAEAMMHNCIPVISYAGGMPEVVGNNKFTITDYEPNTIANTLYEALSFKDIGNYKERIFFEFTLEKRAAALLSSIEEML